MSERFYVNSALAPGEVQIEGTEAHHLARVCRLRPGDRVCLFNGDGREYPATVSQISRRAVVLEVFPPHSAGRELDIELHVAAPLPKGDRGQFLVEKLTELGVTHFVPLRTARSVVHPAEGKRDKLERAVIEASKQCGRNRLLEIEPLSDWDSYCRRQDLPEARWLAHPGGTDRLEACRRDTVLAVGPEGGFTLEEVEKARQNGWRLVDLGPTTLRIETAALALVARATSWI
jgi:16S rRNA (uracil1498-N3)-methyltransferase